MKEAFCPSLPFQHLCKTVGLKLPVVDEDGCVDPSILMLFYSRELIITLNSDQPWKGVLKQADSEIIQIDNTRHKKDEWGTWFTACKLGMLTGVDYDLCLIRMTDTASYGIDPSAECCIALSDTNMIRLKEFIAQNDTAFEINNIWDYPLLYKNCGENNIEIISVGNPVPKVYFGRILKYIDDFGAGHIVPIKHGKQLSNDRIRFIAEDLMNTLPGDIDTVSNAYDVSYTVGRWQDQSTKAENICYINCISLNPEVQVDIDLKTIEEWSKQFGAKTDIIDLSPLPIGREYGLIYYYKPQLNGYVKVGNLFKNPVFLSGWAEERTGIEHSEKLPILSLPQLFDTEGRYINTVSNIYLVSYVPHSDVSQITIYRTFPKRNLWMVRTDGNQLLTVQGMTMPEDAEIVSLPSTFRREMDQKRIDTLLEQWEPNAQILSLYPLEKDNQYGFLYYYLPEYSYIKVSNLYKNKQLVNSALSEQLGSPVDFQLPNYALQSTQDPGGGAINTQSKVYLVTYSLNPPDYKIKIVDVYEKKDVYALFVSENKLVIISATTPETPAQLAREENLTDMAGIAGEELPFDPSVQDDSTCIALPKLPNDGSQYALVTKYARSYQVLYFYRIISRGATGNQYRIWTIAKAEPKTVLFYSDENAELVQPDAIFNTLKYAYVVRIHPENDLAGSGAPFVRKPVYVIREFAHTMYSRIEIEGSSLRVYGYGGEGIVRPGSAPQSTNPPFVKGETLLVTDGQNKRIEICPSNSFQQEEGTTVYRFGVLSSLLRDTESQIIVGGYLNGNAYFSMDGMNDQTKNVMLTSRKRILLLYTYTNGQIYVTRVLPGEIQDIPWKKGIVKTCVTSAEALYIDVETHDDADRAYTIRHFQSVETDGYVNNAAKNGYLNHQAVFVKEIACPGIADEEPPLVSRAVMVHCEQEKAVVQYAEMLNAYYAYRFNPKTGVLGTIRVVLYGSESALSAVKDQQADIYFISDPENNRELYAYLQGEKPNAADRVRPQAERNWQTEARTNTTLNSDKKVDMLPIGQLFLGVARKMEEYCILEEYLKNAGSDKNEEMESRLTTVFSSSGWEDQIIAAALLKTEPFQNRARTYCTNPTVTSSNAYLRRALRSMAGNLFQHRDFMIEELMTYILPLLESDSGLRQVSRDLYIYLVPCFYERLKLPGEIRKYIMSKLSSDDVPIEEQEFVKRLNNLLEEQEYIDSEVLKGRASKLVQQLIALDITSLDFFSRYCAAYIHSNLANAIRSELGIPDDTWTVDQDLNLIFHMLEQRHLKLRKKVDDLAISLRTTLLQGDSVCAAIQKMGRENDGTADLIFNDLNQKDREYFQELIRICNDIVSAGCLPPAPQLEQLDNVAKIMEELQKQINKHPTQIMVDLLYGNGGDVWTTMYREIIQSMRTICDDSKTLPMIRCSCNEEFLQPGQPYFTLNLENGEQGDKMHREIKNAVIKFEVIDGMSDGDIPHLLHPDFSSLRSGELYSMGVELMTELQEGDEIRIDCTVEYEYSANPEYDEESKQYRLNKERASHTDTLLLSVTAKNEEIFVKSPYHDWIDKKMDLSSRIFVGRKDEMETAKKYLMGSNPDEYSLIAGKTLIIYGQKQCGKTSFLHRLRAEIQNRPEAIVLFYDNVYSELCRSPSNLSSFNLIFYSDMLDKFLEESRGRSPQLDKLANEYERKKIEIESSCRRLEDLHAWKAELFQKLMNDFQKQCGKENRIVLIIDEFTELCTVIRDNHRELRTILGFIRSFSEKWGFIQIIVGHSSMLQYLKELNIINKTVATAFPLFLSELKEEEAEELIRKPMKEACHGYDPLDSPSGAEVVKKLMDWSGCYPNYLLLLCDRLFQYSQPFIGQQIDYPKAADMLNKWMNGDCFIDNAYDPDNIGFNPHLIFDPILCEDFDNRERRTHIEKYLRFLAQNTYNTQDHQCDQNVICYEIGKENSHDICETLINRGVLLQTKGNVRIKVGLYREYIHNAHGDR